MITTVFRISLLRLWNNKQELLLALVVPILFFSIFALIFGRGVGSDTPAIKVAVVDDDMTPLTAAIVSLLREQPAIQLDASVLRTNDEWPIQQLTRSVIRFRRADIVIYLPPELERHLQAAEEVAVQVLSEGTNPIGRQIVDTLLTRVVAVALAKSSRPQDPPVPATRLAAMQPARAETLPSTRDVARQVAPPTAAAIPNAGPPADPQQLISVATTDVFAADKHNPKIAMYAAGIAVMFLLFSATGAGGSLLEEYEAGTLDRLLSTQLSITQLLAGKWIYITCLGCVQLTVMFSWAQLAFGVDLLGHLGGFAVLTFCTAAATASLALCLAVLCRSRAQLNGISIVLILSMSALGGSMVPRYIMSEEMRRWGQLTFNAWALDGFNKVFWYDLPVSALFTEVRVLLFMAVALACVARAYADRWAAS